MANRASHTSSMQQAGCEIRCTTRVSISCPACDTRNGCDIRSSIYEKQKSTLFNMRQSMILYNYLKYIYLSQQMLVQRLITRLLVNYYWEHMIKTVVVMRCLSAHCCKMRHKKSRTHEIWIYRRQVMAKSAQKSNIQHEQHDLSQTCCLDLSVLVLKTLCFCG